MKHGIIRVTPLRLDNLRLQVKEDGVTNWLGKTYLICAASVVGIWALTVQSMTANYRSLSTAMIPH